MTVIEWIFVVVLVIVGAGAWWIAYGDIWRNS